MNRPVSDSQDGYLIPTGVDNQYAERSAGTGKRFGRLKAKLGFGEAHVFHGIRRTAATPEGVAADIIGHAKPAVAYGGTRAAK